MRKQKAESGKPNAKNFLPLTYLRSVEELRCGARTVKDHPKRKIERLWDLIVNLKEDLEEDLSGMGYGVRGMGEFILLILSRRK